MKLLKEFINPEAVRLTATQKGILATIASSPTPQMAFENCSGVQSFVVARNALKILGMILISGNQLGLTDLGKNALITNNLVDDSGQLTGEGEEFVKLLQQEKTGTVETEEAYAFLKSLPI